MSHNLKLFFRQRAESLKAIAQIGLAWNPSYFDRDRYLELLRIASEIESFLIADWNYDQVLASKLHEKFQQDVLPEEWGYVTPKITVAAAVLNSDGEILLVQRRKDLLWDFPAGWCDIGYTATATVVKEVAEETGLTVKAEHLVGVYDSRVTDFGSPVHTVNLLFACHIYGGELRPQLAEIADACFCNEHNLPNMLPGAVVGLKHALAYFRGETRISHFDI